MMTQRQAIGTTFRRTDRQEGTPATRSPQRTETCVEYGEASGSASSSKSKSKVLSAWNLARLPSAHNWSINRFLRQHEEVPAEYPEIEILTIPSEDENQQLSLSVSAISCSASKDENRQLGPGDSPSYWSASSVASTRWSDQFCDRRAILPSRVIGVLQVLGYRPALVTTDQLDRLIEPTTEPT